MSNKSRICLIVFLLVFTTPATAEFSDFAVELIDYSGSFGSSPYNDPCAVLGHPATDCKNTAWGDPPPTFRVKLIEAPYNFDLNDDKVITTINEEEYITVKFDHKVIDFPSNLYGQDFIIFGNSFFTGSDPEESPSDTTNMNSYQLSGFGGYGPTQVSVSQDGVTWYTFDSGPYADDLYATQAYLWDRENTQWTDELMDFTKPINPNLVEADFQNISAADAIDLYNGSAGGTSYDLQDLAGYENLAIDSNSGYRWIQYVRLEGIGGDGQIDAVSDVAACGDPTHPYPIGDINKDCSVDLIDFTLLAGNWLDCTYDCD